MSPIRSIESLTDSIDFAGRKVLLRVDFNVPLSAGRITSDARIRAALPTLRHCLEAGAALVVSSHLGRPKGKRVPEMSLEPVGVRLSELLAHDVVLADDCVGDGVKVLAGGLKPGHVLLLENLRFHAGEKKNDPAFVRRLVEPFDAEEDIYINDAFGACHREHASVVGVARKLRHRAAGFLLEREVGALTRLLDDPSRPFVAIIGGAKVADKIGVLTSLLGRVDTICIGGAMAYTFLSAIGTAIGTSRCEEAQLATAREFVARAEKRGLEIILPSDHVVAAAFAADAAPEEIDGPDIPQDMMGLDIGSATRAAIATAVGRAETVFWNGPMGVFEWEAFADGTRAVARAVARCSGYTVVGGGDSVAAIEAAGVVEQIDHVSTGGGASLELLQHGTLPGITALQSE